MLVLTIFAVFGTTEAVQQGDNGSRQLGWSLLAVAVLALAGRRLALLGGGALAAVPLVKGVSAPTYPGGRADQTAIGMPTRKPSTGCAGATGPGLARPPAGGVSRRQAEQEHDQRRRSLTNQMTAAKARAWTSRNDRPASSPPDVARSCTAAKASRAQPAVMTAVRGVMLRSATSSRPSAAYSVRMSRTTAVRRAPRRWQTARRTGVAAAGPHAGVMVRGCVVTPCREPPAGIPRLVSMPGLGRPGRPPAPRRPARRHPGQLQPAIQAPRLELAWPPRSRPAAGWARAGYRSARRPLLRVPSTVPTPP
jgi:hypothetical protein